MFFWRKNKNNYPLINDKSEVVSDFKRRFPFENYRPVSYRVDAEFEEKNMFPLLNDQLKFLLQPNGGVDSGNDNMLNNMIIAKFLTAYANLTEQKGLHLKNNRRLAARWQADRSDFERLRDACVDELEELETAYEDATNQLPSIKTGDAHET